MVCVCVCPCSLVCVCVCNLMCAVVCVEVFCAWPEVVRPCWYRVPVIVVFPCRMRTRTLVCLVSVGKLEGGGGGWILW